MNAQEAVQACLEEIRRARLAAGAATAAKAEWQSALKAAEADRKAAAEAKARGEVGAEQRYDEAGDQWLAAQEALEMAQDDDEAAGRVIRNAEARLHQIRLTHFEELAEVAEASVQEVAAAAERLAGPLSDYLAAFQKAVATWRPLGPAAQAQIRELDHAAGRFRDVSAVMADAELPECPVPVKALQLVRTVMPRPRFLRPDYMPPEPGDDGVTITDMSVTA